MSKKKEKKIKRLRKAHIWPSILLFLLSIAVLFFAGAYYIGIMMLNKISDRFNYVFTNAYISISSFEIASGNEEAFVRVLKNNNIYSNALFVFDENGELLSGYGEETFRDAKWSPLLGTLMDDLDLTPVFDDRFRFAVDLTAKRNLLDENGNLILTRLTSLPELYSNEADPISPDEAIFQCAFWLKFSMSDGKTAYMQCFVPLYQTDFQNAASIGGSMAVILLIPLLFLFINVLISIHNLHRSTKLLYTDPVTAGSSYLYFEHSAGKALKSKRRNNRFLIADITLMKYRSYCNYHGVREGESLLESVDKTLSGYLSRGEVCAHTGKASFALLLKYNEPDQGEARLRDITQELEKQYLSSGILFHSGLYFPDAKDFPEKKTLDPADCLSRASAARATLSDDNISATAVYNNKLLESQLWEHKVEEKMQAALDNEEFQVYIQPKYNPVTEELAGAEALIRWINEEDGFISPGRFIPIFEKNGFITKIDDYMISHVAKLQADWLAAGKKVVPISVNVSRAHFASPDLAQHICELVDAWNVPHHLIEIELTESAFFDDKESLLKTVHQLRGSGFEVSMDDFGAGYSSLNSLKDLPLDVLKLDADFFRGEDTENRREIVVSQAIQLAKSLNMRIVAEGVEEKSRWISLPDKVAI